MNGYLERAIEGCGIYCDPQAIFIEAVAWLLILVGAGIMIYEAVQWLHRLMGGE